MNGHFLLPGLSITLAGKGKGDRCKGIMASGQEFPIQTVVLHVY